MQILKSAHFKYWATIAWEYFLSEPLDQDREYVLLSEDQGNLRDVRHRMHVRGVMRLLVASLDELSQNDVDMVLRLTGVQQMEGSNDKLDLES